MREGTSWRLLVLCLVIGLLVSAPAFGEEAEPQGDDDIPYAIQEGLRAALLVKVNEIRKETDESGVENARGSHFDTYEKIGDDRYQVVFHKRIAGDEALRVERYRVTLEKTGDTDFKIVDEEFEKAWDGVLYRHVPGDETFHNFKSFEFAAEGLEASSGPGTAIVDYFMGVPDRVYIQGKNMKWSYTPPAETDFYSIAQITKKVLKEEYVFDPHWYYVDCAGESCKELLEGSFKGLTEATLEQVDGVIAKEYKEGLRKAREARKDNPITGFLRKPRDGVKIRSFYVKRDSVKDHWAWLTYNNEAPEELKFGVTGRGNLFSYYSKATRDSGQSPYDLEERPDVNALDYHVVGLKGKVDLAVADSETLMADVTYDLEIKRNIEQLFIGIAQVRGSGNEKSQNKRPTMRVKRLEDGDGNELSFVRLGGAAGVILLSEPLDKGDRVTVRVQFQNDGALYKLNHTYSYLSRGGWLPFVRFGDMIDEFELTIRVPERYEILGIGKRDSEKIADGLRVEQYSAKKPVTFPTIIFGDYISMDSKVKATKLDGTDIPVMAWVDRTSTMSRSKIQSYDDLRDAQAEYAGGVLEIRPSAMQPIADQAANSLNLFKEIYQVDYPFRKLDLVNDPIGPGFYGQAPSSIVYLGTGVWQATGSNAHFGGTNISRFNDEVVAHEVAHQWWGGVVTNANSRNYWFVESLAEYSSAMYVEAVQSDGGKNPQKGWKAYLRKVGEWRDAILKSDIMASVQYSDTVWSGEFPGQSRQALIYNQGPYAFHILRMTFGEEKFFAFMRALAQELQGREIVTRDIQRVAEQSFGGNMDWFFDQWIRGVGLPQYSFNYRTRQAEDGNWIVEGNIKQRIVVGKGEHELRGESYRGIISITVDGADKQEYPVQVLLDGPDTPFQFKVPVEPIELTLNKNLEMLAHDVLENRSW